MAMTALILQTRLSLRFGLVWVIEAIALLLWLAVVFIVSAIVLLVWQTSVFAAPRHPQLSAQSSYTFDGDRYVWSSSSAAATAATGSSAKRAARRSSSRVGQARGGERRAAARDGYVTIDTAAGIAITVASEFAPKIQGFIADVVASGYHPKKIHCAAGGGHVAHSLHYVGRACDFDQRGWGLTARFMYHVSALAEKWGLRDGKEFADSGHIDDGPHLNRHARIAAIKATPFYGATSLYHDKHNIRVSRQ
jgi:hypothetical protein